MPCPHFQITIVQRSAGQSAVAGAAYQSGEKLACKYDQQIKDYSRKKGVAYTEVMLPPNAPKEYADRQTLWNAAEGVEKQWNAQLARRIVLALPREVPPEQYPDMLREFCREQFVSKGMCVDFAIHDTGDGNPHAHIMLTMRAMGERGKWLPKSRKVYDLDENGERIKLKSGNWKSHKENTVDWNNQEYAEVWRHSWEVLTNRYLEQNDRQERVDLRSFDRQGITGQVPTVHMGPAVTQMERRGIRTMIGDLNRDIKNANSRMTSIRNIIRGLQNWINSMKEKFSVFLDACKEPEQPELIGLIFAAMEFRKDERQEWSAYSRQNGDVADLKKMSAAITYLQQHDILTLAGLEQYLSSQQEQANALRNEVKANENRIKEINTVFTSVQTCSDCQSVYNQYDKIFWKTKRGKFAEEHPEVEAYKKTRRFLDAHPADEATSADALNEEIFQLQAENKRLLASMDSIKSDMELLRTVRRYIGKVLPPQPVTEKQTPQAPKQEATASKQPAKPAPQKQSSPAKKAPEKAQQKSSTPAKTTPQKSTTNTAKKQKSAPAKTTSTQAQAKQSTPAKASQKKAAPKPSVSSKPEQKTPTAKQPAPAKSTPAKTTPSKPAPSKTVDTTPATPPQPTPAEEPRKRPSVLKKLSEKQELVDQTKAENQNVRRHSNDLDL
ncbi:MAG: MobA/MobL family protein [Lachnospiraceae bacterium]|nr:MobA/MobL family protein [Lachnospiraceae bacterium]